MYGHCGEYLKKESRCRLCYAGEVSDGNWAREASASSGVAFFAVVKKTGEQTAWMSDK